MHKTILLMALGIITAASLVANVGVPAFAVDQSINQGIAQSGELRQDAANVGNIDDQTDVNTQCLITALCFN